MAYHLKEKFGAVMADAESGNAVHNAPKQKRGAAAEFTDSCPRIHSDIFTLNGTDYAGVDLVTGGFPCQPFSVAGKRRGKEDDRAIWPEMLRVIAEAKPRWVLGENVAGIITMELDNVLSDLEGISYSAWPIVIPACAVNARHRRDRVWIMAHAGCEHDERRGVQRGDAEGSRPRHRVARSGSHAEHVADAPQQLRAINGCETFKHRRGSEIVSDDGCRSGEGTRPIIRGQSQPARWEPEPELGRVAHGVPNRSHRLRALGNAIVPQVAEVILKKMAAM